jgi:hypothetical protein
MPNWCNNTVELGHEDPTKLKEAVDAFNKGEFCNYAIPVPESLKIVAGRVGADDNPDQIKLEEDTARNLEVHGFANWYDFCVARWSTKWDVGGDDGYAQELNEGDTSITLSFDSAWSPPIGVYEALVEQGFTVKAYYYEPGMCYAGVWDNGDDNYYELGSMDSKQIREEIDPELDEVMGISESVEMWEEENKEEENEN